MFSRCSFDFHLLTYGMNVYHIDDISKEVEKHEDKKFGEGSENDWILVSLWENMFLWSSMLIILVQDFACPVALEIHVHSHEQVQQELHNNMLCLFLEQISLFCNQSHLMIFKYIAFRLSGNDH